ncbi:MAG: hypothetical protein KDA69_19205, partial [Planctomycetaceae bacterium]|nr:hypothetical protein [Planctomycetaceae bacterium]
MSQHSMNDERCQCEQPGWCERHGCSKPPHFHKLCRTRPDYFRLWEQGRGPGQSPEVVHQIAPIRDRVLSERPWEGNAQKKPWHYRVTAVIPVIDTVDLLEMAVELLRLQTER